jgi:monoamine oxidase
MLDLSRRRLLQAGASLPILTPMMGFAQAGAVFDADVAIIGAGAAGLAAARELQTLGKSFVLIEARDRVGGRVFTDTSLGEKFDAGAVYIHWAEKNPWAAIARDLGLATVDSEGVPSEFRLFENGARTQRNSRRGYAVLSERFDTDIAPVPDVPLTEHVSTDGDDVFRAVQGMARMSLGEEAERVSSLDYARLWSGVDLLLPDGYGALVERFARDIPVRLSTQVRAIDWSGAGVAIETDRGTLRTRSVIVTVSVGVLRAQKIRFTPPLPDETLSGLEGLGMGALTKIALRFDGDRFDVSPGTDLWELMGPRATFDFECWPFDRNVVVVIFGGDHAREVVRMGEAGAVALALEQFGKLVGRDARAAFRGGRLAAWSEDPYAMGCYSHAIPGHANARAKLALPVAERIFFAGEATGGGGDEFGGAMTAGGAYLAGQDAARKAARLKA